MPEDQEAALESRYYVPGAPATEFTRLISFVILAFNLYLIATVRSVWGFIVFGPFVLGGAYGMLRRTEPGLFVELQEDRVFANYPLFFGTRIKYSEITTADFARYSLPEPLRQLGNLLIAFSRMFGGVEKYEGKRGEIDDGRVFVRLKKTKWVPMFLPPFVLPRRAIGFVVGDDGPRFLAEVRQKIPAPSAAGQ